MLSEKLKSRMSRDRPMTSITMRIPVDVVESLKAIAPRRGFAGYQTLLKAYLSEGIRRDEAVYLGSKAERLVESLRRHGVSEELLQQAEKESV